MKFFIDNNLSQQLATGMRGFGEDVIHLREKFAPDANDPEWLQFVGSRGYLLVTRDERVRWRPAEQRALRTYKVGAFFLGGKARSRCELIQQLVRNWLRMKELANRTEPPYAFRIPPTGSKITKLML